MDHGSVGARRRQSSRSHSTVSSPFLLVGGRVKSGKRPSCESEAALSCYAALASPRSSVHTATPRSSFQVSTEYTHIQIHADLGYDGQNTQIFFFFFFCRSKECIMCLIYDVECNGIDRVLYCRCLTHRPTLYLG